MEQIGHLWAVESFIWPLSVHISKYILTSRKYKMNKMCELSICAYMRILPA